MKRYYEVVAIFSPVVKEEKIKSDIERIKSIISNCNGKIIKEEDWGRKKLAYEIKKFDEGIYYFIFCEIEKTTFPDELKKFFATNEDIIRYGIKKIEKLKKKTEPKSSEETKVI
ncbi:MAG: 30S ribosomal protein S6 [Elusimicrobiota bacterium]|nr:30S ribosomal protein S6 [Endomicrobiia bacterium]MDW8165785.1 30S ribosomal protein S6 [Elusimicrobiota bacterium]